MIFGSGVDIVEVYRMRDAIDKWGDSFLKKIFTDREIKYSNSKRFSCQHFAARFAAKEAVVKAFGEPKKFPIKWTEIEVLNDGEGKPMVKFHNDALKLKSKKRITGVMLSISHSRNYAVANVILLKGAS
ncbi:MAG: holo-ACP synthase [Candidatus Omnitrophica bacterium]|nr:holo-ACP synthase [Candidatus Omnitrophota bacterium]MDD5436057.1 holo-ACP synthase [Candidatus Omnitrophota bacterium]